MALPNSALHPDQWFWSKKRVGGTKTIDFGLVNQLQPDLIIANKEENVKDQVETLAQKYPVWLTDVANLDDALQMILDIGELTGKSAIAKSLKEKIESKFENFFIGQRATHKKLSVAYLIWRKPYMTVGGDTFINDMIEKCGLTNIFKNERRYPEISVDQISTSNLPAGQVGCQVLLLSSEPYPFKQKHIDELQQLLPNTKIILVDGEMFSWYGSRLLKAPAYFSELLENLK